MRNTLKIVVMIPLLSIAGCGAADDRFVQPTGQQMSELQSAVASVDWSNAEERVVALDEFSFTPSQLTFTIDQPYELTLKNDGGVTHSFVSAGFFDAIAAEGLIFADGEVKMPILESLTLEAGESKTLLFVPLKTGEFSLICEQLLHETFGMEGTIRIE